MSGRHLSFFRAALLAAIAAATSAVAQAQTMDYGALEKTFGEPVTTSATGQPQRVTDVPAEMEIVASDQIRRSGAIDIPGVLKQVPGVDVLRWGTDNADVSVRGYDQAFSPRLMVLVDGRQVYADHYGFTPWTAVPIELSEIRQIEVVKGPNTALFGANAVSGAINIITYNPLYDDVNNVSVTGGTQGTIRGSAVTTIRDSGNWALRLSGSAGLDNDFDTAIPAPFAPASRFRNSRAAIDADSVFQIAPRMQVGLEASHSETFSNDIDPSYSLAHERHITDSIKGQLNADTDLGLVQFLGYTNWISEDGTNSLARFDFDDQSTVLQLQDVLRLGSDNVVRGAVEFRHNEVNTTPVTGGRIFYDMPSISGMWNWAISQDLSLTNAIRFDSLYLGRSGSAPAGYPFPNTAWDRNLSQWSFNSGLVWKASQNDTLRLLASRGVELPSLADFGATLINSPFFNSSGWPGMAAEAVMNYEVDWDRPLDFLGASFRAALFHQDTTNIINLAGGFVATPVPYSLTANIGDSNATGGELTLNGMFSDGWHWRASYRFESVKDNFVPMLGTGTLYADFEHTTPKHQLKAGLGWTDTAWEADIAVYYQSLSAGLRPTSVGTMLVPVAAYANADARIGYRINPQLTLSLSGENLFTDRQMQTSGPDLERRVFLDISAGF